MKTINPLSNPEDIKPENPQQQNVSSSPIEGVSADDGRPANGAVGAPQLPKGASTTAQNAPDYASPATTVTPPASNISTQPVCQKSFNSEQKPRHHEEVKITSVASPQTPISAGIVSIIALGVSAYVLYLAIRTVAQIGSPMGLLYQDYLGVDYSMLLIFGAVFIFQALIVAYAALKLLRGSLVALALITGVSFLYFYAVLFAGLQTYYYFTLSNRDSLFQSDLSPRNLIIFGIAVLFYVALIDCWTRSRKKLI